jgi:hypothetical protein
VSQDPRTRDNSLINMRTRLSKLMVVLTISIVTSITAAQDTDDIDRTYGEGNRSAGAYSINGTGVLADMFKNAGAEVFYSRILGTPTRRADVIVWAPNSYRLPGEDEVKAIEQWLNAKRDRTFIFIGRDYDATMDYWVEVTKDATDDEKLLLALKMLDVWGAFQVKRMQLEDGEDCGWFTMNAESTVKTIKSLEGDPTWLTGTQNGKFHMRVQGYLDFTGKIDQPAYSSTYNYAIKLHSNGIPIVTEITSQKFYLSKIYAVVNGSFLLNVPLVNHEHRKLAATMIRQCSLKGVVCFLESDYDDSEHVPVVTNDPAPPLPPSILTILQSWPFGIILMHLIVVGIVYCFFRYPIFGKAKTTFVLTTTIDDKTRKQSVANFGRHIHALGNLLRRSGNETYARNCVSQYQQREHQSETYQPQRQKKKPN